MNGLQHPATSVGYIHESGKSIISRFLAWSDRQENDRLFWVAAIIAGHGCIITPITIFAIIIAGNSMLMWAFAIAAMAVPLLSNLAAMPTKITIPVFFLSIVIDTTLVISSLVTVMAL